jgi:FkbM family methyltransferase
VLEVVNSRHGRIIVSPLDTYVGRSFCEYGEFSEGEVAIFDKIIQPGMVVADVGANFGAFTIFFAKKAAKVYAIEPQRMVYNALCGTVALNALWNVVPVNAAVGATHGTIQVPELALDHENSWGGVEIGTGAYTVPLTPITTACDFLKIDVEGMEREVLLGAAEMIAECKPVMYIENDRKDKAEALVQTIRDLGYKAFWHGTMLYNKDNFKKNPVNVFEDIVSINIFCVPSHVEVPYMEPVTTATHPNFIYKR